MCCPCLLLSYDVLVPPREAKGMKSRGTKSELNRFIVIHSSKDASQTWVQQHGTVATLTIGYS